jgi:hypothetical protein
VTAAERLAEAEARLEELEADRELFAEVACRLAGVVEQLAILAGVRPATVEPARPALRVIQGGAR